MKSTLLFSVSAIICVSMAWAEESLFPELDLESEAETVSETAEGEGKIENIEEKVEENVILKENSQKSDQQTEQLEIPRQAKVIPGNEAEKIVNGEGDTKEAKEEAEKIFIALNNIKTNVTTVRAVSNCNADFVLLNGFKKRKLENISVTLTIGETEKTFSFKNVAPQKTTGQHFVMIGKDCENILRTPQTNITKCQIQGITEKKCIEKVNYISIPTTTNNL